MPRISGRWNLVAVLALACGAPALAAPLAEPAPFDLTYLPPDCVPDGQPQILVALRPAELFARPDGKKAAASVDQLALMMATQIYGITNTPGPGVEALETALLSGHLTVTHNPGAPRPHTLFGAANGIVLRTKDRFDWSAAVARWAPAGKPVTHRDATFTTVPAPALFALMTPAAKDATYSLYAPDDRTLVVGPEDSIRKLIDRLKDGKPAPVPAGWAEVERAAVAVAVTTTDKAGIDRLPKPTDEATRTAFRLARATDGMAGGVWCGDTTTLRMVFTAADRKGAAEVAGLLRDLRPALEDAFRASVTDTRPAAEVGFFKAGLALIDAGRIGRDGRTVRVTAEVEASLLDAVLGCLAAAPPTGPKR
jgi:hypothetical protein